MLKNGKETCSCPNVGCKRNGNCDQCSKHHADGTTYCQRLQEKEKEKQEKV